MGVIAIVTRAWPAALLAALSSAAVISVKLSESPATGSYPFLPAAVPLLLEAAKLLVSLLGLAVVRDRRVALQWWSMRLYLPVAALYTLQNLLMLLILDETSPWTFQLLANLKTVATGLLFRIMLQRRLSRVQWHALALLLVGTAISQLTACNEAGLLVPMKTSLQALSLALVSALIGTYTEMYLCANDDSLWWQNCQIYTFGVCCSVAVLIAQGIVQHGSPFVFLNPQVLLYGFSQQSWTALLLLAASGLLVSWVMRHQPIIIKVVSNNLSILGTALACHALLQDQTVTLQALLGIGVVAVAGLLYYTPARLLVASGSSGAASAGGSGAGVGDGMADDALGQIPPRHTKTSTHPSLMFPVDVPKK